MQLGAAQARRQRKSPAKAQRMQAESRLRNQRAVLFG